MRRDLDRVTPLKTLSVTKRLGIPLGFEKRQRVLDKVRGKEQS
jgi:hypothetical protein